MSVQSQPTATSRKGCASAWGSVGSTRVIVSNDNNAWAEFFCRWVEVRCVLVAPGRRGRWTSSVRLAAAHRGSTEATKNVLNDNCHVFV